MMLEIEKSILSAVTSKPQTLIEIVRKAAPKSSMSNKRSKSDWIKAAQRILGEKAIRTYDEEGEAFYSM